MKKSMITSFFLGVLMIFSAALTLALTPTEKMADLQEKINLDVMIPSQFADWKIDQSITPLQVDADTQAKLDKLYNQILARTYINSHGNRIMLSIAYGGDRGDNLSLHKPEVCYYVQGFEISNNSFKQLNTDYGFLPTKRLLAVKGNRNEPITYWVTVGDKAVLPGLEQKMQQLKYGLTGKIPDGMLVRVSSVDQDTDNAYKVQDFFIRDLLLAVQNKDRLRLIGVFKTA
ncbi:MAG: exosortase-associated protein EpsI, B-type [Nitrosomonas sp.]